MTEAPELNPSGNGPAAQGSIIPLGWKPSPAQPVPVVRCVQIKKDGERCKRWSLRGYTKCRRHAGPGAMEGGNVQKYAESVIEAARLRLVDSTDDALDLLNYFIHQPGTSEGIRLKAATEVLDRAGVRGGFEVKVDGEVKVDASDEVAKRLKKLAEGAAHVEQMKRQARGEDADVVDAEVIDPADDPDQETLF